MRRQRQRGRMVGGSVALVAALVLLAAPSSEAQLISPGRLIAPHAELEGIRNCTSCHELGRRGIDPQRCLSCHTPLATRIQEGRGFHATVSIQCGTCHKDHFGRDFDAIRLDRSTFDHSATGYPLEGQHRTVDCASCHRPAFITARDVRQYQQRAGRIEHTFLGVSTSCYTCHRQDDPHGGGQATSTCSTCHSPAGWDRLAPFDHAQTGFPLAGAHATVSCASCHGESASGAITFEGTSAACRSCHATDDPHRGQFASRDCASCHSAETWRGASRFDHGTARFPLTGLHRQVTCSSCHGQITPATRFGGIDFASCASCHEDAHAGAMGTDCATCHTTAGWRTMGTSFDEGRFDHAATGFPLVGAHATAACASCHARPARRDDRIRITFAGDPAGATFPAITAHECSSCHVDAHAGDFASRDDAGACASCHGQDAWLPTSFDIERHQRETAFPLTGAHVATPCFACHGGSGNEMPHFTFAATTCETCHAADNPHGTQFADASGVTTCGSCHATEQWDLASFDHATTGFPLTGAHVALSCRTCHTSRLAADGTTVHDFTGLAATCASCHAPDDPHQGQFASRSCDTCHDTRSFLIASFDHSRTAFPLTGAHRSVSCASCHVQERAPDGSAFTRFAPLATTCASCHG